MATVWRGYNNRARMGIDARVSGSGNTRTITATYYCQMDAHASTYADSTVTLSGGITGNLNQYIGLGPGGSKNLGTRTRTVTLTDSAQTIVLGASFTHFGGGGGLVTTGYTPALSVSIPARKPLTPTGLTVTRLSDGSHRLNWSRRSTYTAVVVQRRVNGGSWAQVGRPTGNASTYTDNTTSTNNKYEYRVAGVSAGGQSGWSNTATVYTTPAAVTSVSAAKVGLDIRVTATGLPRHATAYEVHDNGVLVDGNVTSWPFTHIAPDPSVQHTYTVYAKRGSLRSSGRSSNTVQLLAAPLAPSNLTPNGAVVASDGQVRFGWTHNPVDTTAQEAYRLRYRAAGTTAWTTVTGTTASTRSVTLAAGGFEWQIQTKGEHADYGPYSAVATVTVVDRPGVAVQGDGLIDTPTLTVKWAYTQAQSRPQSAWQAELLDESGARVELRDGSGAATTTKFQHRLNDGDEYTARVRAATGGIWSAWAVLNVRVEFVPPAPALFEGAWDETRGTVAISVGDGAGPEVANITNFAPTVEGSGEWVEVRRNYVPNPSFEYGVFGVSAESGIGSVARSTNGWGIATGSACLRVLGAGSGINLVNTAVWFRGSTADRTLVDPDRPVPAIAFSARRASGVPLTVQVVAYWYSSGGLYLGVTSSLDIHPIAATQNNMDTNRYYHTMGTLPGAERVQVGIRFRDADGVSPAPEEFEAHLDAIHVDYGATPEDALARVQTYFEGDSSDFLIDTDMRTSWVGVPGESESVMEGELAGGFFNSSLYGMYPIVSQVDGIPAVRLVAADTAPGTQNRVGLLSLTEESGLRDSGMFYGTFHGSTSTPATSRRIAVGDPLYFSIATVGGGQVVHRWGAGQVSPPLTSTYRPYLYGDMGEDVRWSQLGLFKQNYSGPFFDGNTGMFIYGDSYMYASRQQDGSTIARHVEPTVSIDVGRSVDGGATWEIVVEGVAPGDAFEDTQSLSRGVTLYRVTSYTETGAASTAIHEVFSDSTAVWLSSGEHFENAGRLPYDPAVQVSTARDRVQKRYSGRAKPVVYAGEALTRTLAFGGTLLTGDTDVAGIETLENISMDPYPIHLYRDPDGRVIYGMLDPLSITRVADGIWAYTTSIEESEDGDA